jgi:hypothetical protein
LQSTLSVLGTCQMRVRATRQQLLLWRPQLFCPLMQLPHRSRTSSSCCSCS